MESRCYILGQGVALRRKLDCRVGVCSDLVNIIPRDVRQVQRAARVTFPAVTDSTSLGCACRRGKSGAFAPVEAFAFRDGGEACSPTTKGLSAASAGRHNRKASDMTARALP